MRGKERRWGGERKEMKKGLWKYERDAFPPFIHFHTFKRQMKADTKASGECKISGKLDS